MSLLVTDSHGPHALWAAHGPHGPYTVHTDRTVHDTNPMPRFCAAASKQSVAQQPKASFAKKKQKKSKSKSKLGRCCKHKDGSDGCNLDMNTNESEEMMRLLLQDTLKHSASACTTKLRTTHKSNEEINMCRSDAFRIANFKGCTITNDVIALSNTARKLAANHQEYLHMMQALDEETLQTKSKLSKVATILNRGRSKDCGGVKGITAGLSAVGNRDADTADENHAEEDSTTADADPNDVGEDDVVLFNKDVRSDDDDEPVLLDVDATDSAANNVAGNATTADDDNAEAAEPEQQKYSKTGIRKMTNALRYLQTPFQFEQKGDANRKVHSKKNVPHILPMKSTEQFETYTECEFKPKIQKIAETKKRLTKHLLKLHPNAMKWETQTNQHRNDVIGLTTNDNVCNRRSSQFDKFSLQLKFCRACKDFKTNDYEHALKVMQQAVHNSNSSNAATSLNQKQMCDSVQNKDVFAQRYSAQQSRLRCDKVLSKFLQRELPGCKVIPGKQVLDAPVDKPVNNFPRVKTSPAAISYGRKVREEKRKRRFDELQRTPLLAEHYHSDPLTNNEFKKTKKQVDTLRAISNQVHENAFGINLRNESDIKGIIEGAKNGMEWDDSHGKMNAFVISREAELRRAFDQPPHEPKPGVNEMHERVIKAKKNKTKAKKDKTNAKHNGAASYQCDNK